MILEAKKRAAEEQTEGTGFKTLSPKQMLQRVPTALPQVKAGNNSESLLNEIRQIVYSFYQSKQITWRNIRNSYNNNKFKISTTTWNDEFELPDGSFSVSDIQDYFKYIFKKNMGKMLINHQYKYM